MLAVLPGVMPIIGDSDAEARAKLSLLQSFLSPTNALVLVSSDIDKTRRIGKALYKNAVVVECWGLKNEKNPRYVDFRAAARKAEEMVRRPIPPSWTKPAAEPRRSKSRPEARS